MPNILFLYIQPSIWLQNESFHQPPQEPTVPWCWIFVNDLFIFHQGEEEAVLQDIRHDDGAARRRDDQSEIPGAEADHQVGKN